MKILKQLAVLSLAAAMCAWGQDQTQSVPPAQGSAPEASSTQSAPEAQTTGAAPAGCATQPTQAPTIKDPAEYNSYTSALSLSNPNMKAQALEQFLQQYPSTVVRKDALQQLLGAYQQANNLPKAEQAAQQLLQMDPSNVYSLFILAYGNLLDMNAGKPEGAQALQNGEKGLQALDCFTKPATLTDQAYEQLKAQMTTTFNTAAGMGALQSRDYASAQKYLGAAAQTASNDLSVIYPLATAYLSQKPLNPLGFYYGARAIQLAQSNPGAEQQISKYVETAYNNYHGGMDGWQQIQQQAAASPNPPAGFTVTQMTPSVQAKNLYMAPVASGGAAGDCKKADFGLWTFIFENGDPALAQQCFDQIKDVPLAFKAKVVDANKDTLMMAATDDDIQTNTTDTQVTMAAPIPLKLIPKAGEMIGVQAKPVSYDKQPYLLHMDDGKLVVSKKPPVRRSTRRHPAQR